MKKRKTEAGIAGTYEVEEGIRLKVPYAFQGSILGKEELKAVEEAFKGETLTMGPNTTKFQEEFSLYCGTKYARTFTSCTTAMHTATQVLNIKPGDEVLVTPITFVATSLVILKEGAKPVYADIDPRTFNIDPSRIEEKITKRTKAIYVVHYGGQMCDMDPIMKIAREYNLYVLEDCAHAPGAEYKGRKAGSIGDFGAFSFHSLKNMTTFEGGMLTFNRKEWCDEIDRLRCMSMKGWGKQKDYWLPSHFDVVDVHGKIGNNYRMNEVQSAVGRVQLKKLDKHNAMRKEIGRYLNKGLKGIKGIRSVYEDPNCKHVYHLYTLLVVEEELGATRDDFLKVLYKEEGIQPMLHYQPTYQLSLLKKLGHGDQFCPVAEKFWKTELNLPMHPRLTKKDLDTMIKGVKRAVDKFKRG